MIGWCKRNKWVSSIAAALLTVIGFFGVEGSLGLWEKFQVLDHSHAVELFGRTSAIIDHRFDENGTLFLKYKTCNPPAETPEYYYSVWIDNELKFHSQSVAPHFSINTWFQPIFCTEGWWGVKGFEGAEAGDMVVVNWHWQLDDGSYQETIMRYIIK